MEIINYENETSLKKNWKNNMREITDINVNKCNKDKHYTQTQFKLDFSNFIKYNRSKQYNT